VIDYHVHTRLCNHASGTMEQYIRCAIEKGLSEFCFLDHLTLNENGRDQSMGPDDVPLYVYAVRRLQDKYKNKIDIKLGLEVDFTPIHAETALDIINRFSFDMIGGSIHFVEEKNIVSSRNNPPGLSPDDTEFFDQYLVLIEMLADYSCFDVICHLDVVKKFGIHPPADFFEKMDAILTKIKYTDLVIEINTSGLSHPAKSVYPDPLILKRCFEKNIPVTFGSDAHRPEQIGRNFDEAVSILRTAGYRRITGFKQRKRYSIPI
jgi:histidinol-phosphatase (PHP family)